MTIYKTKKGWKVRSYLTGKPHKKAYKTHKEALKAAGSVYRKKYYDAKKK